MVDDLDDNDIAFDFEDEEDVVNLQDLYELYDKLEKKCSDAGIEFSKRKYDFDDVEYLILNFPCGRETRKVFVRDIADASLINNLNISDIRFIEGYAAYFDVSNGEITASFRDVGRNFGIIRKKRFPISLFAGNEYSEEMDSYRIENNLIDKSIIDISALSDVYRALVCHPSGRGMMKLIGHGVSQHDQAKGVLEKFASSLFFQVEQETGIMLSLSTEMRPRVRFRPVKYRNKSALPVEYTNYEYESAPLTLYRYAASSSQMPLMQFLAYYQSIEYFFPTFSQEEAAKSVRNVLKNPAFKIERNEDILRVLNAANKNNGKGFGSERSQLESTIRACVPLDELDEFRRQSDEVVEFFKNRRELKAKKIPVDSPKWDLYQVG